MPVRQLHLRLLFGAIFSFMLSLHSGCAAPDNSSPAGPLQQRTVKHFGAVGDGAADDTAAIQRAVREGDGQLVFSRGVYRITRPIEIDLRRDGPIAIDGRGVATLLMAGPGPALRLVGGHAGTAAPHTVTPETWRHERTPMIDGLEIVGAHADASGIEARGAMQLTVTRVTVREALHGIHLVQRNRNVLVSDCHLYHNRGIGLYLDHLNLHQINVVGCHISYNAAGGVVARNSEIRNLQIGTCDIEGNHGGPDSPPTANVWLDAADTSLGEVAIVGCTLQHSHDAPDSANIRINCRSTPASGVDELRHGNITIADNVLSDVQVNIDLRSARAVTITGNTIWKGYASNLTVDDCRNIVVANNVFDRNPRYHYGDGATARLGLTFRNSSDCTLHGNHLHGLGEAAECLLIDRCSRFNVTGCSISEFAECGLRLKDSENCRVSDCLITGEKSAVSLIATGAGHQIVDNLLSSQPMLAGAADARGNHVVAPQ